MATRDLNVETPHTHRDIDVELPCIDGMLVGTLALMTGYAEHQCEQGNPRCRDLMAKKIVSNLFFLATHPNLSAAMAAVMRNLQGHWHTLGALSSLENDGTTAARSASTSTAAATTSAQQDAAQRQPAFWLPEHASVQ
jgi:hypothetical protein